MTAPWTPEVFEADDGTIPWERFVNDLSVIRFGALQAAMNRVLAVEGINLLRTERLKALGGGTTSAVSVLPVWRWSWKWMPSMPTLVIVRRQPAHGVDTTGAGEGNRTPVIRLEI